ncbi:hypothetical protein [Bergeyella sp. RCAD1439]|uniref:hypothetical protein n=1 Tax=Bergeyella anatis TaxID=3113737 RepID=UPI002E16BA92|nr:hypothetical protein [Bergeyella sp. RCAD1439]
MTDTNYPIATGIDTKTFYLIVSFLKKDRWELLAEYNDEMVDKGVDFDLYYFKKRDDLIWMAWSNWFEGEIKANMETLNGLSKKFNLELKFGTPEYLKAPDVLSEMEGLIKFKEDNG